MSDIRDPIPEEDLARGRNYLALGFPRDFQAVDRIADRVEDLALHNLPDDYYDRYTDRVLSVDQAEVWRAAEKYIDTDRMLIVLVGDRAKIEPGVAALNLGKITNASVEDLLGPPPAIDEGE